MTGRQIPLQRNVYKSKNIGLAMAGFAWLAVTSMVGTNVTLTHTQSNLTHFHFYIRHRNRGQESESELDHFQLDSYDGFITTVSELGE